VPAVAGTGGTEGGAGVRLSVIDPLFPELNGLRFGRQPSYVPVTAKRIAAT
jgi:hypothetical protein